MPSNKLVLTKRWQEGLVNRNSIKITTQSTSFGCESRNIRVESTNFGHLSTSLQLSTYRLVPDVTEQQKSPHQEGFPNPIN